MRGASPSEPALRRLALTRPGAGDIAVYLEELCRIPCPDVEGAGSPAEVARELWGGDRPIVLGAGRDSFKTLVVANVEFLLAHHLGLRVVHFGAFEKQAKQAREYVAATAALPWWAPHVRVGQTQASFRSGGWIKFQALTHASARSAHVPLVAFDEADECRPDARRIAVNIASSTAGRTARTIDLSTKNRPSGPMARMIANASRSGHRVIQYDYKAVTEQCPDECSGTGGAAVWIHRKFLLFGAAPPAGGLDGWEEVDLPGPGCVACPLVPSCRGDLKRSNGVLPIVDLIRIITEGAWRAGAREVLMSLRGSEGAEHLTEQDVLDHLRYLVESKEDAAWRSDEGKLVPDWRRARDTLGITRERGEPGARRSKRVSLDRPAARGGRGRTLGDAVAAVRSGGGPEAEKGVLDALAAKEAVGRTKQLSAALRAAAEARLARARPGSARWHVLQNAEALFLGKLSLTVLAARTGMSKGTLSEAWSAESAALKRDARLRRFAP